MGAENLVSNIDTSTSQEGVGLLEKKSIQTFLKQPENEALRSEFAKLNQISNAKAVWAIARQWIVVAMAVTFAIAFKTWWSYALAIVVIATRQHAFGILLHEGTHWRLFSKKWANDLFANIFCGFPINISVSRYRYEHLLHHQYNMQEKDPYKRDWDQDPHWHFPKTKGQAFLLFFRDLFSLNMSHLGPTIFRWSPWANHFSRRDTPPPLSLTERLSAYVFFAALIAGLSFAGAWLDFLLLWVLPMSTLTVLFGRVRSVVEHLHLPGETEFNRSRHVDATLLEKLTIAPLNINVHIAHHLFPAVPQYHLPRLHEILLLCPTYRQEGRIYDSYLSAGKRALDEMIR